MQPFRKHVAIAIDGGGIRGLIVTRALEILERALGTKLGDVFQLAAGSSTGSIVAAGIALQIPPADMTALYCQFGPAIFARTLRSRFWPLFSYRYPNAILKEQLERFAQGKTMGDLWNAARRFDLVIVTRDLHEARSRFIKPWKPEYQTMPITTAVLASAAAPTYFPVMEGRFIDGGVGSFNNPCFLAAYEAQYCQAWDPSETTLLSLGTGKPSKQGLPLGAPDKYKIVHWVNPLVDSFMSDAGDQQARIVDQFFPHLDFRRFQIPIEPITLDDVGKIDLLLRYGEQLGEMILRDQTDPDLKRPTYKIVV